MQSGYCNLSEFVVKFLQYGKEVFMEKLVLIDGNSLINRAFYATKLLTTREGVPTNGVFGFTKLLLKIISDIKPAYMAVSYTHLDVYKRQ